VLDADNRIGSIKVSIPASGLTALRVGDIAVENPVIHIDLTKPSPEGGVPVQQRVEQIMGLLAHLNSFAITNGAINLTTPYGELPLKMDGSLAEQTKQYQWKATLSGEAPFAKLDGQLTATIDKGTQASKAHLELGEAKITTDDLDVKRLGGWISAESAPGTLPVLNGQLTAGVIKSGDLTLQGATLSLSTTAEKIQLAMNAAAPNNGGDITLDFKMDNAANKGTLDFQAHVKQKVDLDAAAKMTFDYDPASKKLAFKGTGTPRPGLPDLKIKGEHDAAANTGSVSVDLPPFALKPGGAQLTDILPGAGDYIKETTGTVGMSAHIRWSKKNDAWGLKTDGQLLLKQFSGMIRESKATDINTVLHFDSLLPPVFTKQTVSVGLLDAGLPLANGELVVGLDRRNAFSLNSATWSFAKGTISSSPFTMSLKDMNTDVTLTAKNIDLVELFKLAPMQGLDATGTVNGTIPLQIRGGNAAVIDGVLETVGPGAIRYSPKEVPAFLQDTTKKQIVDLRVALTAFDYESLKVVINGEAGKTQKISLQAKGKNPGFYEGHPVNLNFNVEGPLQNVIRYNPGGSQIPDNILKQIESYEKEHAAK
jgi:hypothetical protein